MATRGARVSQALFDSAVEENVETFGLDRVAAATAAVEQFVASGADLTGVVTTADGAAGHPVVVALAAVRAAAAAAVATGESEGAAAATGLAAALRVLATRVAAAPAHRAIAGGAGAVDVVAAIVVGARPGAHSAGAWSPGAASGDVLRAGADALRALTTGHDVNRAAVPLGALDALIDGMAPGDAGAADAVGSDVQR